VPWPQAGAGSELLFRPEDAAIVEPGAGQLSGRVATAIFLGDRTRLAIAGIAAEPILVDTAEKKSWRAGDPVGLRISPAALLTL
jgi:putative spermidine/putrescine transport system ATP-binding protein